MEDFFYKLDKKRPNRTHSLATSTSLRNDGTAKTKIAKLDIQRIPQGLANLMA